MAKEGMKLQELKQEKQRNLETELQEKLAKTIGADSFLQVKQEQILRSRESLIISKKLQGLELLKKRVKAQGSVVAADMVSKEKALEYKEQYGLSAKEVERMLNEMQQGQVEDFNLESNEYGRFETRIRSQEWEKTGIAHAPVYAKMAEALYQKRKQLNPASFQLVALEEGTTKELEQEFHLSSKELKKISLDIQTRAVRVKEYGDRMTVAEEMEVLRKKAQENTAKEEERLAVVEEEVKKLKKTETIRRTLSEQELREDKEKRTVRKEYLKTGVVGDKVPKEWILKEYAELIERILGESCGEPMDLETVVRETEQLQKNLLGNRDALENEIEKQLMRNQGNNFSLAGKTREMKGIVAALEQSHPKEFLQKSPKELLEDKKIMEELKVSLEEKKDVFTELFRRGNVIQKEIGKDRIDLSSLACSEIKELYDIHQVSEQEFERRVSQISKQTEYNLKYVDLMLEERVSLISRQKIFQEMTKRNTEIFVLGTAAAFSSFVENYLEQLPEEMKQQDKAVKEEIDFFLKYSVKKAEMPMEAWERLLQRTIGEKDTKEQIKEKLSDLSYRVKRNIGTLRRNCEEIGLQLPMEVWDRFYEYRNEMADLAGEEFNQKTADHLINEILKPYKNSQGRHEFGDKYLFEAREYEVLYMTRQGMRDPEEIRQLKEEVTNVSRLKGSGFLTHPEFEYDLCFIHGFILKTLDEILYLKQLPLDFLEKITCVKDLDNLSYGEMEIFLSTLRNNLRGLLKKWTLIRGSYGGVIKANLMKEMMKGKVNLQNIDEKIAEEKKKSQEDIPRIRKLRTRFLLSVEDPIIRQKNGLEDLPKDSYLERHKSKFEDAHLAWKLLREAGKEKEALEACTKYTKYVYSPNYFEHANENPAYPLKELLTALTGEEEKKLGKKLAEKLSRGRAENFMNEFLLCDYPYLFLNSGINPDMDRVLTQKRKEEKDGEELINTIGTQISRNNLIVVNNLRNYSIGEEKKETARRNLMSVAMGLYVEKKNIPLENLEAYQAESARQEATVLKRTGIKGGDELAEEMRKHGAVPSSSDSLENQILNNQIQRYEKLKRYGDGILKPLLPNLLADDVFWTNMALLEEKEFFDEIDKKIRKTALPLEILKRRFSSLGPNLYEEICGRFAREILLGEEKNRIQWLKLFDDYFKEYSERRLGNFSLQKLTETLEKNDKDDPVIPYLTEIFLTNEKGLDLAANKRQLNRTLEEYRERISKNQKVLEEEMRGYVEGHPEEFQKENTKEKDKNKEEAFRKGCEMYLQTNILQQKPENFAVNLKKWMNQYLKLRADMTEEIKEAEEHMDARREMVLDVVKHKDEGILSEEEDPVILSSCRKNLLRSGSPLLMALGVNKRPGRKQIEKAKEITEEKFKDYPKAVKNCLMERRLSQANEKTLQREAEWLNTVYTGIGQYMENIVSEQKKWIRDPERMKEEALLYAYILRIRTKNENMESGERLIRECFHQLITRHKSMAELLDKKYTWALEYEPVFWKTSEEETKTLNKEENPVLSPYRHLVLESLAAGFFTMSEEEFTRIAGKQKIFFEAAEQADKIFEKIAEEYVEEKYRLAARHALLDYFRADLRKGLSPEQTMEIQQKAEEILKDENYRDYLLQDTLSKGKVLEDMGSELSGKLKDVSGLQEHIGKEERTMHTVADRETMEYYLYRDKDRGFGCSVWGNEYRQLTGIQRQIFALSVLLWNQGEVLPGMEFVTGKELEKSRYAGVSKVLEEYANGKKLSAGDLDYLSYDRVLDRLCESDGTINVGVFKEAMELTREYIRRHHQNWKDFDLLKDADTSLEEAKRLFKEGDKEKYRKLYGEDGVIFEETVNNNISNIEEFRKWITCRDPQEGLKNKEIMEMKNELSELNDYQMRLLTLALTDRTILDFTTAETKKGEEAEYVNREKREMFLLYCKNPKIYQETLTKAEKTLQSYQIRDDLEISSGNLLETDFARGALKRETVLDWQLLRRGIDFIKAISK